jgi:hypothetical protein
MNGRLLEIVSDLLLISHSLNCCSIDQRRNSTIYKALVIISYILPYATRILSNFVGKEVNYGEWMRDGAGRMSSRNFGRLGKMIVMGYSHVESSMV